MKCCFRDPIFQNLEMSRALGAPPPPPPPPRPVMINDPLG